MGDMVERLLMSVNVNCFCVLPPVDKVSAIDGKLLTKQQGLVWFRGFMPDG